MRSSTDVVVVGAGLAGLACARSLTRAGLAVTLLDAADAPGGRIRTDVVEGFRLDRGFQVFLTAYPEAAAVFDYDRLRLGSFRPGALVRAEGRFHRVVDPFRDPLAAPATLTAPVGTLADKFRLARLQMGVRSISLDALFDRPEAPLRDALARRYGFGPNLTERFFRPFFGGISLDPDLNVSSRFFEFVFRTFAEGEGALPADGMEALPRALADALPPGTLRLHARVAALDGTAAVLDGGERVEGRALVVATEAPEAERLAPGAATTTAAWGEACLYFAAPAAPYDGAFLVLNGDGEGPINNLSVVSNAQPAYAPEGQALVSVVVLGEAATLADDALEAAVRRQLGAWYGADAVSAWRHLRTYRIPYGLPDQTPPFLSPRDKGVRLGDGRYRCGDYVETGSINGALRTGRLAADAVRADLAA